MSEFQSDKSAPDGPPGEDLDTIDQASADSFPASDAPATGGTAADDRVRTSGGAQTGRISPAQLEKFLAGVDYPADKENLLEAARQKGAGQKAIEALRDLPQARFDSPTDVSEAVGRLR